MNEPAEKFDITTLAALEKAAERVLKLVTNKPESRATVLALSGELGAGKTTFTQTLGKLLGIKETINSPTFVIMRGYNVPDADQAFTRLYHLDAYRIDSVDEMRPLGFVELLKDDSALFAIEWPERIAELLPPRTWQLTFTEAGDGRALTISQGL